MSCIFIIQKSHAGCFQQWRRNRSVWGGVGTGVAGWRRNKGGVGTGVARVA